MAMEYLFRSQSLLRCLLLHHLMSLLHRLPDRFLLALTPLFSSSTSSSLLHNLLLTLAFLNHLSFGGYIGALHETVFSYCK